MGLNIFAMPASSIILLFSVALGVSNALPWAGPEPTDAYVADAWSPVPTGTPADPARLFKRTSVDVNVCGWLGGDVASPAACDSGSSCVHDTVYGAVGCCTTSGPCTAGIYTSCVDGQSAGGLGGENNGVYTCPGTSACYQNTYAGGYFQYNCGSPGQATTVLTSYSGMPSDMNLQIVYTNIDFAPNSAQATTPSSTTATSPKSSGSSTTNSPSGPHKENAGAIAGFTLAGFGFLVSVLALAFIFWRRRRSQHRYRAGPFISHHVSSMEQPPSSGPFQRIGNSSYDTPDDFMKHRSGLTTTITAGANHEPPHPGTLVFPDNISYAGAGDPHHPYTSAPSTPFFPPERPSHEFRDQGRDIGDGEREEMPLVSSGGGSEIEDFSRGFHDAMAERLHDGDFSDSSRGNAGIMPGGIGGSGIGLGLGNYRTEDREARSEAFRERVVSMGMSPPLGSHPVRGFSYDVVDMDREREEEFGSQPTDLRSSSLIVGLGSAVGRRTPEDDDERPRYQLDEIVGEDVPILHSPRRMSQQRQSMDEK